MALMEFSQRIDLAIDNRGEQLGIRHHPHCRNDQSNRFAKCRGLRSRTPRRCRVALRRDDRSTPVGQASPPGYSILAGPGFLWCFDHVDQLDPFTPGETDYADAGLAARNQVSSFGFAVAPADRHLPR